MAIADGAIKWRSHGQDRNQKEGVPLVAMATEALIATMAIQWRQWQMLIHWRPMVTMAPLVTMVMVKVGYLLAPLSPFVPMDHHCRH